jgi:hypothetical protein
MEKYKTITYRSSDGYIDTITLLITEEIESDYVKGIQTTKKGGTVERLIDYDYIITIS